LPVHSMTTYTWSTSSAPPPSVQQGTVGRGYTFQ
jgi:hypothetical protein